MFLYTKLGEGKGVLTGLAHFPATDNWCAMTTVEGDFFEAEEDAVRWLAARGYAPDGQRLPGLTGR